MTQRDLFPSVLVSVPTVGANGTAPLSPRELGTNAAKACAEKAERKTGFDLEGARARVIELLRREGPTSGEDLVDQLKFEGFRGHDDRCFGPVFAVLVRRGSIRCAGYCTRRRGHGTAGGRIWELVVR